MMLGTVPTSVPQFILLGNWLLEGKFQEKWHQLKNNKLFWILSSVFLMHVLGMIYSSDLKAAWDDVRTKIPLMYLPLVFFTSTRLKREEWHYLLYAFLAGTMVNLGWCFIYKNIIHHTEQVREVSRFMSHIRLGFLVDMAIFICFYFISLHEFKKWQLLFLTLAAAFLYSLYELGLMSGVVNILLVGTGFGAHYLFRRSKISFILYIIFLVVVVLFVTMKARQFYNEHFTLSENSINKRQKFTLSKRPFNHYPFSKQIENGVLVTNNIQEEELQREWNRRVPDDSIHLEQKINLQRYFTLVRFISGKHQWKDSASVASLNETEIALIRQGIPNHLYSNWSFLKKRFYELVCELEEYQNNGNVNGHSFTMRLYYLKSAISIIKAHPAFGVGTGDVQQGMNEEYDRSNSPLDKEWYKRPHNQFVTITVALGIAGLFIFLLSLIWPIWILKNDLDTLYYLFFSSVVISFLFEDTLETQIGLSFFAVFNTLFLTQAWLKRK